MSKKLVYLLGILFAIVIGTILHWLFSCECTNISAKESLPETEQVAATMRAETNKGKQDVLKDTVELLKMRNLREEINRSPIVINFNTAQSEIILTSEEKLKLERITQYMANIKDATVVITGHSDNTGNRDDNIRLGQERAEQVKSFLVENGFIANRILTDSKGPDEPVDDNSTPEGRAQNRRAVILIK